jgi:hypothetical protein
VSRAPFDETALLIANGIRTTVLDAAASLALPFRLTATGTVGHAVVGGGRVANSRRSAPGALRVALRARFTVGVSARQFGYAAAAPGDGYFAPSGFLLVEGITQLRVGRELGWSATLDGGVGRQTIRFTPDAGARGNLAQRVGLGLLYRPAPGTEFGAAYGFANTAAPGTVSAAEYRALSLSLRARPRL